MSDPRACNFNLRCLCFRMDLYGGKRTRSKSRSGTRSGIRSGAIYGPIYDRMYGPICDTIHHYGIHISGGPPKAPHCCGGGRRPPSIVVDGVAYGTIYPTIHGTINLTRSHKMHECILQDCVLKDWFLNVHGHIKHQSFKNQSCAGRKQGSAGSRREHVRVGAFLISCDLT